MIFQYEPILEEMSCARINALRVCRNCLKSAIHLLSSRRYAFSILDAYYVEQLATLHS